MSPADILAAARANVVGPYLPARREWLEGWCGPVLGPDGVPGAITGPDHRPEDERYGPYNVAAADPYGWEFGDTRSCKADELLLDVRRPEVRDHLVRLGCPAWARDVPAAVWAWGMGVSVASDEPPWEDHVTSWRRSAFTAPRAHVSCSVYGWVVGSVRGPETGDEGRARADLVALRAGCILRVEGGWLVPLPDGGIGFFEEVNRDE